MHPRFVLLIAWLLTAQPLLAADKLLVVTEDLWPMNYLDNGELKGKAPPLVRKLLARAGLEYDLQVLPWPRAYALAENRANVLIFSINRTEHREPRFHWIGMLAEPTRNALFSHARTPLQFDSLEEAKSQRVATKINGFNDQLLRQRGFTRLHPVPTTRQCILMLRRGRVDLLIGNEAILHHYMAEMQIPASELSLAYTISENRAFVAASLTTPTATVQRLRDAYRELVAKGEIPVFDKLPGATD